MLRYHTSFYYKTVLFKIQYSHSTNSTFTLVNASCPFYLPYLRFLLPWKGCLLLSVRYNVYFWKLTWKPMSQVEWWDQSFSISLLKLSQSCLDKDDWIQMNSKSLCSARLATTAFLWSFHWVQSSAPSHCLLILGNWQDVTDSLPPISLTHLAHCY